MGNSCSWTDEEREKLIGLIKEHGWNYQTMSSKFKTKTQDQIYRKMYKMQQDPKYSDLYLEDEQAIQPSHIWQREEII